MASTRRLLVKHRTEFTYAAPARESVNEVRLGPVDGSRQRVEQARLRVTPDADVVESFDAWGNRVWWFQVVEPHEHLVVESESVVATVCADRPTSPLRPADQWREIQAPAYRHAWADFLLPSGLVHWTDATARFADDLAPPPAAGVAEWAAELAASLNAALVYERGHTDTTTTVDGVIAAGHGVCQDFAHVFVALCRLRGVAAKYVSGWLFEPDRGGPVESHAWTAVQVPGVGWVEQDPTHPGEVGERYVRIAVGRDYADVVPIRGTYLGGATVSMNVEVELRDLGALAPV